MSVDKNELSKADRDDVLSLVANISEADIVKPRSNCKLCNCEFRAEAEDYWDRKGKNASAVVRFLADKGVDVTDKPVKNHMEDHYEEQKRALRLKNYAEKIRGFANVKTDRVRGIEICRGILMRRLLDLDSQVDALPLEEQRRTTELVTKVIAQINACDEAERKFNEDWKPAKIVIEKLEQIVQVELATADDSAKPVLARVVSTLFDGLEGFKFDK